MRGTDVCAGEETDADWLRELTDEELDQIIKPRRARKRRDN